MRVVLDTNVIVSATLSPDGPSGRLLERFVLGSGQIVPVIDGRMLDEYREVLSRRKFRFPAQLVEDLLEAIEAVAVFIDDVPSIQDTTTPQDDRPFLEVAVVGGASFLVTGNARHFKDADRFGVDVIAPGAFLRLFEEE